MAGLAPGTLKNVDAHQRKVILYLLDYAPSTRAEVMADLHMEAKVAGKAIGWLTCRGLARPVGDGFSLTEDGHKAAHTIITISNMIARLGLPRHRVPICDDAPPIKGCSGSPSADPRTEWAVQVYAQSGSIEAVAKTIHTDQRRAKAMLLAAGVELQRLRRQAEAGD